MLIRVYHIYGAVWCVGPHKGSIDLCFHIHEIHLWKEKENFKLPGIDYWSYITSHNTFLTQQSKLNLNKQTTPPPFSVTFNVSVGVCGLKIALEVNKYKALIWNYYCNILWTPLAMI